MNSCKDCHASLDGAHLNRKRCETCASVRRAKPVGNLTDGQASQLLSMIDQYTRSEIADMLGVSRTAIGRWLARHELTSNAIKYKPDVIEAVLSDYILYGKVKTQELHPGIHIRSIYERYVHKPRQVRWAADEIVEAARMAGLVRANTQARYFNRPGAYDGSIKALWVKRFQCAPRDINGLAAHLVWRLANPGVTATLVYHHASSGVRAKVLWVDLASTLRDDLDDWVVMAVMALAKFQAWLHQADTSDTIRGMIIQRESTYGRD